MDATRQSSFVARMIGAARLDEAIYEEVERDRTATMQAAQAVALSSGAAGLAALVAIGVDGLVLVTLVGLGSWAAYAYVTYFIGVRWLAGPDTSADWGEVARTLGFAQAPGVLRIFGFLPAIGLILGAVASIWILVTTVVALRAALDFTTGRAIATAVLGWIVFAFVQVLLYALLVA